MKAKVIALNERGGKPAKTTVNGLPVALDDVVEVDENTFRNLANKGILGPAEKAAEKVDLDEPSRLSEAEARKRQATAQEAADERAAEQAHKKGK